MEPERQLIDVEAAKGYVETFMADPILKMAANAALNNAPRVDAVEVVHGEWSTIEDDYCGWTALQCSVCKQEYFFEDEPPLKIYNYCPNCGAKMDGDGDG